MFDSSEALHAGTAAPLVSSDLSLSVPCGHGSVLGPVLVCVCLCVPHKSKTFQLLYQTN